MPEKQIVSIVPLSGGIRRSRDADPFFTAQGELTDARNGTFTQEGGFLQHGGVLKITSDTPGWTPATDSILWLYRWYRGEGDTNPILALIDDGTNRNLWYSISDPTSTSMVFTLALDFTTNGSGATFPDMDVTTYFTVAEMNGYLILCSDDVSDTDKTYVCNVNGSVLEFFEIGAVAPTAAPTETNPVSGSMASGVYSIAYTYVYGTDGALGESNPSPKLLSTSITANDKFQITVASTSRQDCSAIRIYLSLTGAADTNVPHYFRLEVANDNGPHEVDIPDTTLSFANTEMREDMSATPHTIRSISTVAGRLFGVLDSPRNRVRISEIFMPYVMPDVPTFFNDELNAESGPKLTTLFSLGTDLYATSESGIWRLVGNDPSSFIFDQVPSALGYTAERSIQEGEGMVYGLGTRDIVLFDGLRTSPLSRVRGLVEDIDPANLGVSISAYRDKKYYLGVRPDADLTYTRMILVGREPTPARESGFAVSLIETDYQPDEDDPTSRATFEITAAMSTSVQEVQRLYVGMTDGHIYEFDSSSTNSFSLAAEDLAGPSFELTTGWYFPADPHTITTFHKFYIAIENIGSGGTVDVGWDIMDDSVQGMKSGLTTIDLEGGIGNVVTGQYNFSRYS